MSARNHPRLIGVFVLGAVALVVTAVVFLSTGRLFEKRRHFSVFFPGSVKGLDKGSAVTFRGVKIGEVADVTAFFTGQDQPVQIEVALEFRREVVALPSGQDSTLPAMSDEAFAQWMIKRGIRGRMLSASLLTGQRYIDFDFLPQEPSRLAGVRGYHQYPELPTTPTALERLSAKAGQFLDRLADLPLDQMLDDVRSAVRSLRTVLESPDVAGAAKSTRRMMDSVPPAVEDARATLKRVDQLVDNLSGEVDSTGGQVRLTVAEARETLARAQKAVEDLQQSIKGTDQAQLEATRTLAELSRTLNAFRTLAEYIQTHPEAVVIGKPKAQERK